MLNLEIEVNFYQLAKKYPAVLFTQIIRNLHKLHKNKWKSVAACGKLLKYRLIWPFREKVQADKMRVANSYGNHENNYTGLCPDINPCVTPQGRICIVALILLIFLVTGMIHLNALSLYSADSVPRNCVIWPKATPRQWVFVGSVRRGLRGLRTTWGKSPPVFSPLPSFFYLSQEKNPTNVPGKAAPGSLLAPTN